MKTKTVRSGTTVILSSMVLLTWGGLAGGAVAAPTSVKAAVTGPSLSVTQRWSRTFACPTGTALDRCGFVISSPTLAQLDGQNDILIGSQDGQVYAVHQSDGSSLAGWPAQTGHPIESSPAVDPSNNTVYVGSGDSANGGGGYFSFDAAGHTRFAFQPTDFIGQAASVYATPAIGDITKSGAPDIVAPTLQLQGWALNENGNVLPGWPRYQTDSSFASPALLDVGNGSTDAIIAGDDSSGGLVNNRGGVLQAVAGNGSVLWTHTFDETIDSSPSVGNVGAGAQIAVGGGDYYSRTLMAPQADATTVKLFNPDGTEVWSRDTGAYTRGSPTVADVMGTGTNDIIEGTWGGAAGPYLPDQTAIGKVFAWNGTGQLLPGFPLSLPDVTGASAGGTQGQIVTADFTGDGAQDLVVPGGFGVDIYDVAHAQLLARVATGVADFQNSPLVIDNHNGTLDVVVAGEQSNGTGIMQDYKISPSAGTATLGSNGWPMFRHDARRTGSTLNPPLTQSACDAANTPGYWEIAADGGIFSQCAAFLGSIGGHVLNQPVVSGVSTPDRRGYWEVASDGGIFAFGDAKFFGSTGGIRLAKPIVGMAATPDGGGYWLVASDGGIFSYGDAKFFGSTGGVPLSKPVVGMAANPGGGYWLVASDGGIFTYGGARFFGSTGGVRLAKPVVGMAATPDGGGYWLVASDGGIFTYGDAPFAGSTGSLSLVAPIVALASAR